MDFSAECTICHEVREIQYFEYDPVLGWTCIDCEAATNGTQIETLCNPQMSPSPMVPVKASQAVKVMA